MQLICSATEWKWGVKNMKLDALLPEMKQYKLIVVPIIITMHELVLKTLLKILEDINSS